MVHRPTGTVVTGVVPGRIVGDVYHRNLVYGSHIVALSTYKYTVSVSPLLQGCPYSSCRGKLYHLPDQT